MAFAAIRQLLSTLPIVADLDNITAHILSSGVTIVSSDTGSGKTLLTPTELAQHTKTPILVLEPRRFLVTNTAETVSDLSHLQLGHEIGYATGIRGREDNFFVRGKHQITYMTFGYALATQSILEAEIVFIDEAHEQSLDMTICKALLKKRLDLGQKVTVIIMSATMDVESEMTYWEDYSPKVFHSEGKTHECELIWDAENELRVATLGLIQRGRKGILVFVPGVADIRDFKKDLEELLKLNEITNVEIAEIHGQSSYAERKVASAPPMEGNVKVLVGTNVIESGVNIPWVDSGVSTGTGKEVHVNPISGAIFLKLDDLPLWRLKQQEGRVKRFGPGIYVLCNKKSFKDRPVQTVPEILRLPLTELVMHCAKFDIGADELRFNPQPPMASIIDAEKRLKQYGFINDSCQLTDDGRFVQTLPTGVQTAAILVEAHRLGILETMILIAAVVEVGGVRKDMRFPHYNNRDSDVIDGAMALARAIVLTDEAPRMNHKDEFERLNVGFKKFTDANDVVRALQQHFKINPNIAPYMADGFCADDPDLLKKVKACIFAGYISNVFNIQRSFRGNTVNCIEDQTSYKLSTSSVLESASIESSVVTGQLRVITPKKAFSSPFTVAESVTVYSHEEMQYIAELHPTKLRTGRSSRFSYSADGHDLFWLLFDKPILRIATPTIPTDDYGTSLGAILDRAYRPHVYGRPTVSREMKPVAPIQPAIREPVPAAIVTKSEPVETTASLAALSALASNWGGQLKQAKKR